MADILIAGGGIAGSSLAILVGRRGFTVELYERGQFPKEKPCGEGLMPGGIAVLERMGLAEAVGGAPFWGIRYHFGNQIAVGHFPAIDGFSTFGYGQRRRHLDYVLFRAAAATPGVTAHTGAHVDGPLVENGKVTGLLVEGDSRRGALVVAADGNHSRIRRALGLDLPVKRKRLGARCHFRLAQGQEQPPWVDVFVSHGRELYVTPLPNRELLVAALADREVLREPIERAFRRWWQAELSLAVRLEGAEQISSLLCTSPLTGQARCGIAPGVVLLGDAAGFLDPITGGGMTQGLMTAELLAKYVHRRSPNADLWLQDYDRQRNLLLRDYRRLTQIALWLADHPVLGARLVFLLHHLPDILSHLISVAGGMRPLWGSQVNWKIALQPQKQQ